MAKKISNEEFYIDEIYNWITLGFSNKDIYKTAKAEFGFSTNAIKNLLKKVDKKFKEEESYVVKENKATERLLYLYKKALSDKNYRLALDVQKELNKVQGLTATNSNKNLLSKSDLNKYAQLTDAQLEEEWLKIKKIDYEKDLLNK